MACSSKISCKGLYDHHIDTRTNLCDIDSLQLDQIKQGLTDRIKKQAESIACLVNEKSIPQSLETGEYHLGIKVPTLAQFISDKYNKIELGEQELFREEPVIGTETAFSIGRQLVLTTAHSVCHKKSNTLDTFKISETRVVFGFQKITCRKNFPEKDVYRIANVVAHAWERSSDTWADWAVLKLDREVENRVPLTLNFSEKIEDEKNVYMLGHPTGLPLKLTYNAEVKKSAHKHYFEANLDAFKGNSGSPIFSYLKDEVIGILCEGHDDYVETFDYKGTGEHKITAYCVRPEDINQVGNEGGYEKCQKVTSLSFLRAVLPSLDIPALAEPIANQVSPGISVEGVCRDAKCRDSNKNVIVSFGFKDFVDISWACSNAPCPSCKTILDFDDVNIMVLAACKYQIIKGESTKTGKVVSETFTLLDSLDKTVRFDVRDWYYLQLKVSKL